MIQPTYLNVRIVGAGCQIFMPWHFCCNCFFCEMDSDCSHQAGLHSQSVFILQ